MIHDRFIWAIIVSISLIPEKCYSFSQNPNFLIIFDIRTKWPLLAVRKDSETKTWEQNQIGSAGYSANIRKIEKTWISGIGRNMIFASLFFQSESAPTGYPVNVRWTELGFLFQEKREQKEEYFFSIWIYARQISSEWKAERFWAQKSERRRRRKVFDAKHIQSLPSSL